MSSVGISRKTWINIPILRLLPKLCMHPGSFCQVLGRAKSGICSHWEYHPILCCGVATCLPGWDAACTQHNRHRFVALIRYEVYSHSTNA